MAKRGIDEHPKVIDFAEIINLPVCYAVGPLELFWHWVAKYRPTGDITGIKASAIVHAIRYPGNADEFMKALLESGLVDELPDGRRIVHDWSEHADNSVHQLLKKKGASFADGSKPFTRNQRQDKDSSQTVHEPFTNCPSLPEPEPEPEPVSLVSVKEGAGDANRKVIPPEKAWVAEYAKVIGMSLAEAGKYYDHHQGRGWKLKTGKMVDWQACMRTWKANIDEGQFQPPPKPPPDSQNGRRPLPKASEVAEVR